MKILLVVYTCTIEQFGRELSSSPKKHLHEVNEVNKTKMAEKGPAQNSDVC